MVLDGYIIKEDAALIDALQMIDANSKGFLIVVDEDEKVVGTLTDGDIRRFIIKCQDIQSPVRDICNRKFTSLTEGQQFDDVVEIFKGGRIHFLPVLRSDGTLRNVITKPAMHAILMQDITPDILYPFLEVDETVIDHEVYSRPWGFYKTTILNELFQSKLISVNPGAKLSFQYHNKRQEHWIIVDGEGEVRLDDSLIPVRGGSYVFIPKGCRHRIANMSQDNNLIFIEVQLGTYFGEDDIIRIEDDYGRVQ